MRPVHLVQNTYLCKLITLLIASLVGFLLVHHDALCEPTSFAGFDWSQLGLDVPNITRTTSSKPQVYLNPVILVPGDGGSRLQAKLDRKEVSHHYCERKSSDWFDLWLNLSLLVPFAIDCWIEK